MTFTRGLFIHPDATRGTTALEARQSLAGLITTPGVMDGLRVTGTAGWQYSVSAGHVATSRDIDTDGVVIFGNDAPVLVDCSPAPGTGARIDIIYAKHNDATSPNADPNSEAFAAVAEGVASGTPTAPELPEGGVELARATVGAGATNTAHANVTLDHSQAPKAEIYRNPPIAGGRTGNATTSIPHNTITNINTGSEYHYMGGVTGAGSNGGLTVPVSGWYDVDAGLQFGSDGSGYRRVILMINGTSRHMEQQPGAGQNTVSLSRQVWLDAGDVVNISGWQSSGSTMSTTSNWGFPYLNVALIGRG